MTQLFRYLAELTTTTTITTTTIIPAGVCYRSAGKRVSGSPRFAIAHLLSTSIYSGGFLLQPILSCHSTLTSIHHPTPCSNLHQYFPHLFLVTRPFRNLCTLHMCGKNNTDSACSHLPCVSNDSLQHSPLGCVSCENLLFNA